MAIDNRLQVFNEEGQSVDYDILASDVKFLPDGKDLPTKLAEMETHQGDGTVKGVKMNNGSPIEPDGDGVVDLGTVITQHQDITGKVDKETGKSLMSAEEHTKLEGIETGAEKNIIKGIKANGASTNLPVDQNGVVELPPAGSTISPATASPSMDGTASVGSSDKYAREDHVHPHDSSKQNTLTFDNTPTAGNTDHVVSSAGIRTALDTLLQNLRIVNNEWYIGNTPTGVSAQGPTGNVEFEDLEDLVALLVNDLTTGGAGNFLSAEMGKVLKTAISTLIDSMGEYCFPSGRPTLSWEGAKADIITHFNNGHVTSSNTAQRVDIGASFETTLGTNDNLYVIDDDSVVVKMGGVTQVGAYTAATGKVTIAEVTDYIEITANAITYVGYGESGSPLVFMLDAKNSLDLVNNKWTAVVGNVEFSLTNVTLNQAGTAAVFDSSQQSKGVAAAGSMEWLATNGTIESVFTRSAADVKQPVLTTAFDRGFAVVGWKRTADGIYLLTMMNCPEDGSVSGLAGKQWSIVTNALSITLSMNSEMALLNGTPKIDSEPFDTWTQYITQFPAIGYNHRSNGDSYLDGTISCIRIYNNKKLTQSEQEQNYKVDQKRFNLT